MDYSNDNRKNNNSNLPRMLTPTAGVDIIIFRATSAMAGEVTNKGGQRVAIDSGGANEFFFC